MSNEKKDTKFVGGQISQDLYWRFKQVYTQRKESATEALTNAILLYLELPQETNKEEEKDV